MHTAYAPRHFAVATHSVLPWLLLGGLTAGTLDLLAACGYWALDRDASLLRILQVILQAIASWVLGRGAYAGGWDTALLGALLHYAIMITMVASFHAASRQWPRLLHRPLRSGALYGACLYVLMFVILVPHFSAVEQRNALPLSWTITCFLAYVLLVGIPSALFARAANRAWH